MAEAAWFGGRLRELREGRGLSQKDFAALSGLGKGSVSELETGRYEPTLTTVLRVTAALGLTLEEMLSQPPEETAPRPRGRPRKAPPAEPPPPKRPRGRPRKEK